VGLLDTLKKSITTKYEERSLQKRKRRAL